jgi:hypothetical protein
VGGGEGGGVRSQQGALAYQPVLVQGAGITYSTQQHRLTRYRTIKLPLHNVGSKIHLLISMAHLRHARCICSANSRAGARTSATGPSLAAMRPCAATWMTRGSRNAAVLPLPVDARPSTSRPLSATCTDAHNARAAIKAQARCQISSQLSRRPTQWHVCGDLKLHLSNHWMPRDCHTDKGRQLVPQPGLVARSALAALETGLALAP